MNGPTRFPNHPLSLQVNRANSGTNVGATGTDPALQTSRGPAMNVTAGTDFEGMRVQIGGYIPSDNSIAVGPNHIVQMVNGAYTIYNKSGAPVLGPNALASVWAGLGGQCAANTGGTPAVEYDQAADRWIITQQASLSGPYAECIAVSVSGDPMGAYNLYSYAFASNLNGDAKLGVWPTATNSAYLASYNLFASDSSFAGAEICAYDRAGMLAGAANPASLCFTGITGSSFLPVDADGATAPLDGTPAYFADLNSTGGNLGMYSMSVDFGAQTAALKPFATLAVDSFNMAGSIAQPGTSVVLDSMSDRLMYRLAFRMFEDHESMVVTHAVATGGVAGVRWYELRAPVSATGSFTLFQQGTFAPADGNSRWMGSAAMDGAGDLVLGYSASGSNLYPALRYTGRTAADPAGTMEAEASIQEGTRSETWNSQWGEYNAVHIDPSDDCTFWHVSGGSGANTRIGSFKFSGCGAPAQMQTSTVMANTVMANAASKVGLAGLMGPTVSGSKELKPKIVPANGAPAKVGIFRQGFFWLLDTDGNRQWDDPPDQAFAYGGIAGDIPITGDWTGDGHTKVGIYRSKNGFFLLDTNGDEVFDTGDAVYKFLQNVGGPQAGDVPVVGDWNGSGTSKIGIVRDGFLWLLDLNGDGIYEPGTDLEYVFGGVPGDIPVVGDWTGTGTSKIGVLRDGFLWLLDANGNGTYDATSGGDYAFAFGAPGDVPVVGDWTGDGVTKVGMFRDGFLWVLDASDPAFVPTELIVFAFGGVAGDVPVVGKWFSPPVSITSTGGTPQSTVINSAFPAPLVVSVNGSDGYGVSGVTMAFAVPGSGASATFAGGATTAVTNAAGTGTSALPSANGTVGGAYSVRASIASCGSYPGCGSVTPASFSLTNTMSVPSLSFTGGNLVSVSMGTTQNIALNIVGGQAGEGLIVSLISSDTTKATVPASVSFPFGATSVNVPVTGVAQGVATITASGPNLISGSVNVSVSSTASTVATWYAGCWEDATIEGVTGAFQSIDFALTTPTPVTVEGTLFYTANCDPSQGSDNMNDFGAVTGSGHWIQGFIHHPNVIPSSAVYWIGPLTANGLCPAGAPCSGCVSYTATTISCSLAP